MGFRSGAGGRSLRLGNMDPSPAPAETVEPVHGRFTALAPESTSQVEPAELPKTVDPRPKGSVER